MGLARYYLKDTEKNTGDKKAMEVFGNSCTAGSKPPKYYVYGQVLPNWDLLNDVTYVALETKG